MKLFKKIVILGLLAFSFYLVEEKTAAQSCPARYSCEQAALQTKITCYENAHQCEIDADKAKDECIDSAEDDWYYAEELCYDYWILVANDPMGYGQCVTDYADLPYNSAASICYSTHTTAITNCNTAVAIIACNSNWGADLAACQEIECPSN